MTARVYVLSCRLDSGPLWVGIYHFLWWFLLFFYWLFVLYWRYELPCQDKLPEFHYTPILGCIRVLWLVFHPLGLGLDKALFVWNSVNTDPLGIKPPPYDFEIPLCTAGTIIYADIHAPTQSEFSKLAFHCHHVIC